MNKIVFGNEHLSLKRWDKAVYKITFNHRWYYIGSSVDVKRRLHQWKNAIINNRPKNGKIRQLLPILTHVSFEILRYANKSQDQRIFENEYISKYHNDENCLNLCPDAFTNFGSKRVGKVIVKEKKQPIAVFDIKWIFLKRFDYVSEAIKFINCRRDNITDVLKGRASNSNGFKFKLIDATGQFIEPIQFISKKPPTKPKREKQEVTQSKAIIQYNKHGKLIKIHSSVGEAAKEVGSNKSNFRKQLTTTGNCKGYIFKYA